MIRKFLTSQAIHTAIRTLHLNSLKSTTFPSIPSLNLMNPIQYPYSKQTKQSQLLLTHANKYLHLINSLKDVAQFDFYRSQAETLLQTRSKFTTYKGLKLFINDMLIAYQIISWAQAYHHKTSQDFNAAYLRRVEELIQLSFSPTLSASHESIQQENSQAFETLRFSTYFELVENPSPQVSNLYLNSYIHINRERNLYQFVKVYEALRQAQRGVLESQIANFTEQALCEYAVNEYFDKPQGDLSVVQMAIFLTYLKGRLSNMAAEQQNVAKQHMLRYLQFQRRSNQSLLHLQNVCYCLYLCASELQLQAEVCQWLMEKYYEPEQSAAIQYLMTLYAHEDKLTCIKVDTWIQVLEHTNAQAQQGLINRSLYRLNITANYVLKQLYTLSYSTWRYKYIVWMLHNVCDRKIPELQLIIDSPQPENTDLQLLNHLIQAITNHNLTHHRSLFSFTLALKSLAEQVSLSQMANIDVKIAKWLSKQPKQSLLSQTPDELCQILHYADRHPALHPIYLPYLQRLLEVSLGEFEWTPLTEIYYFGLRWKAEKTDGGDWQMEYVRRYILNEYAEMGIRRRDIPEDSYFYKIHTLTTPEKFYKNHIEH